MPVLFSEFLLKTLLIAWWKCISMEENSGNALPGVSFVCFALLNMRGLESFP